MQPRPRDEKLVVDPRPGNKKVFIPKPNPRATKAPVVKPLPIKKAPVKQNPIKTKAPSIDDKIYRTMPITEKQLGSIKKMYGI
jgi:hypothetical protein